jgi:hypothetical protein
MKSTAAATILAVLLTIVYGVAFSFAYPLVDVSDTIVALCALCAVATSFGLMALWSAVTGRNKT